MSAWGKLHAAALELAKGTPLKQRLATIFSKYLTQLEPADLPAPMRADIRALLEAFESVAPLRGESAAQATIRKMSVEQAEELAARVVTLYGQLARFSNPRSVEDPARAASAGDATGAPLREADVLPLFAAEA
jgi:hypothetical protein